MTNLTPDSPSKKLASTIAALRSSGKLPEAIELCKNAVTEYTWNYFFPKILGDLYFQQENYNAASKAYLEYLRRIPPAQQQFGHFARRYYRLRRVLPKDEFVGYLQAITLEIQGGGLNKQNAYRSRMLIKSDAPEQIAISRDGRKLLDLMSGDTINFNKFVAVARKLELNNSAELEYLLNQQILNRERGDSTFRIDAYVISVYEKMGNYDNALKIAAELSSVRRDPETIRSIFRICRKIENYEHANDLLAAHPEILKGSGFNVLYELVYYFEAQDNFEQVQLTLNKIERNALESIPIQKTVKNFYLRFGLLEDASRVGNRIADLSKQPEGRFSDEVRESEAGIALKIKELYSDMEHKARLAAISDLTTGISHELGQPITNIRYTIQFYRKLFAQKMSKGEVLQVFDSILEETERMGALIKRLAPLTSSKNTVEQFDIIDRINRRVKSENLRLRKLKISVNVLPRHPVYLEGDPVKFDQLIGNLLLNSIDAINERQERKKKKPGRIDIRARDRENTVEIIFSDTGIGIPAKHRGKILDPFFTTKAPGKGEGLGLFIVWNILKMQGGKLILDPDYRSGARFIISIPKSTSLTGEG